MLGKREHSVNFRSRPVIEQEQKLLRVHCSKIGTKGDWSNTPWGPMELELDYRWEEADAYLPQCKGCPTNNICLLSPSERVAMLCFDIVFWWTKVVIVDLETHSTPLNNGKTSAHSITVFLWSQEGVATIAVNERIVEKQWSYTRKSSTIWLCWVIVSTRMGSCNTKVMELSSILTWPTKELESKVDAPASSNIKLQS